MLLYAATLFDGSCARSIPKVSLDANISQSNVYSDSSHFNRRSGLLRDDVQKTNGICQRNPHHVNALQHDLLLTVCP